MPYDEGKVKQIVRDGTNPKARPTSQQIGVISMLTYDRDAVEIIKRMLLRRLDPRAYVVPEAEHTMLMLRSCLGTASHDFVSYVRRDLTPLITQFYSKGNTGDLCGIHHFSGSLLRFLRDETLIATERHSHLNVQTDKTQNQDKQDSQEGREMSFTVTTETLPMTPPETPNLVLHQDGPMDRTGNVPLEVVSIVLPHLASTGLPTPAGSPVGDKAELKHEKSSTSVVGVPGARIVQVEDKVRAATSNTPPGITMSQMEEIAEMTYNSSELNAVQKVISTRLEALKRQQTYHHLVKTLTLVHHCLFYASDVFVESCRRSQVIFENLRTFCCPDQDVRSRAEAVLERLKDVKRLQQERRMRKQLSNRRRSSSNGMVPHPSPLPGTKRLSFLERATSVPVLEKLGDYAVGKGGYSDVWKGRLTVDSWTSSITVAIKILRLTSRAADSDRLRKRLEREVNVWRKLEHESVAEFYGVMSDSNDSPAIISPWYDKGSADTYLRDYPDANPIKVLWEIVLGVEYLHDNNVVHGDLKGGNVMVDEKGHAKLIDFGLSRLIDSVAGATGLTTSSVSFSIRWCAPELVQFDDSQTTKASDVYAFASTALELLTGEVPYQTLKERAVLMKVINGVTPEKPTNRLRYDLRDADQLWSLFESCWKHASLRPSISEVKMRMQVFYHPAE